MRTNRKPLITTAILASCAIWIPNAFAGLDFLPKPNVEGLTVEKATKKYGPESGYEQPMRFEVNTQVGSPDCRIIAPDCSKACPKEKIYYQSPHYYLNRDGSRTVKVDILFDVNDVITSRAIPGTKCHFF